MQIRLAKQLGFCYGVKRAIETAENCIGAKTVHTLGPIIHNPQMVNRLAEKGIYPAGGLGDIQEGTVIIRSHGVGPQIYEEAQAKNLTVVDATCPHVKKAQKSAAELAQAGYDVVVIGEKNHPEVKSIVEWTLSKAVIVETVSEAEALPHYSRLGVVVQTTFAGDEFQRILAVLESKSDELTVRRTICTATDERQQAAVELAQQVDLMIVIGGKNSANTTRLAELCRQAGCQVQHIETAQELQREWVAGIDTVGITAGASTPDWIIKEVVQVMEELDEQWFSEIQELERGTIVTGTVVSVSRDEVFVDIGYKGEGAITLKELAYPIPSDARDIVKVGQEINVYVINADNTDGLVHLSKVKADQIGAWEQLEQAAAANEPIEVQVTEVVKGGLAVSVAGIRGFIPASQVALRFVENLQSYVGQALQALPIEVDPKKRRVVLSSRVVLEKEQKQKEEEVFSRIAAGDIVKGTVKRLADFGAFVDISGVQGLIHISDLSWHRVKTPGEIVQPGDEVEVFVIKADPATKKISLSLKQVQRDPWLDAAEQLAEGQIVEGVVTKTAKFGAFVKLPSGIEGLVHLSELAEKRIMNAADIVHEGQSVKVKVLSVDLANKRIALSISKAQQEAERAEYQQYMDKQAPEAPSTLGEKFGQLQHREE